jgi:hypothetical protein
MSNIVDSTSFLPLLNAVLITDLFGILLSNMGLLKSEVLKNWYLTYNFSAVIADVSIILIVLIIARAIYYKIFDTFSLFNFIGLAVVLQIAHDLLFAVFFSSVPRGINRMIDTFKDYAKELSYKAVVADSVMMIMSSLIASYLLNKNNNTNTIVLISSMYLLPYLLYN